MERSRALLFCFFAAIGLTEGDLSPHRLESDLEQGNVCCVCNSGFNILLSGGSFSSMSCTRLLPCGKWVSEGEGNSLA